MIIPMIAKAHLTSGYPVNIQKSSASKKWGLRRYRKVGVWFDLDLIGGKAPFSILLCQPFFAEINCALVN